MRSQFLYKAGLGWLAIAMGWGVVAMAETDEAEKAPYPLTTCVVSGEKLGEMGEPAIIEYEGREVRFCCNGCEKDFRKEPEKYLKMLDEAEAAAAATQPTAQPTE